jgi:predicted lipid-binding transport protein (Tim44 family)
MNKHFFKAVLLSVSLIFATVGHANATRLGGGKSVGKAPSAPMQKQATPAQKPTQQAQPAAPAAAPQAPAPSRFGGMGGILGGLAAGLGIGFLLSHFGLGEAHLH